MLTLKIETKRHRRPGPVLSATYQLDISPILSLHLGSAVVPQPLKNTHRNTIPQGLMDTGSPNPLVYSGRLDYHILLMRKEGTEAFNYSFKLTHPIVYNGRILDSDSTF